MKIIRWAIAAPLAALALAACQEGRDADVPVNAEQTTPQPATEAVEIEPKSIIRPTVIETEPAAPVITPASATIPFADKSQSLSEAAEAQLDEFLAAPAVEAGGDIVLRGHSDSRGHDADNLVASRRRAEAVRDYLQSEGVAPERMTVIALGEARPIAPNAKPDGSDYPEGRARNRRVEVTAEPPAADLPDEPQSADEAPLSGGA